MILLIVPELTDDIVTSVSTNVKVIDYKAFNSLEIHPFIATNKWERIDIVLAKGIISGYIKQVLSVCNIVVAIIPKHFEVDYEMVSRLGEIYQNSAAKIKKAYMQKKDILQVLQEEGVKFEYMP